MKRQKSVFSNSQLCHVFASQTQENGKNANGTLYFEGSKMFSYGRHYLAAHIVENKGRKIVLINSYNYSMATCGHLSDIRAAFRDNENFLALTVPNTYELNASENIEYFESKIFGIVDGIMGRKLVRYESSINWEIERLSENVKESNKYFSLIGHKKIVIPDSFIDLLKDVLKEKYENYKKSQSPENLAKKEALREKREKLENEKALAVLSEKIADFRAGKSVNLKLPFDLLRVQENEVITSRGAKVPLNDAVKLLNSILTKTEKAGDNVGHFSLKAVSGNEENKIVTIGCHRIELKEAVNVLGHLINKGEN